MLIHLEDHDGYGEGWQENQPGEEAHESLFLLIKNDACSQSTAIFIFGNWSHLSYIIEVDIFYIRVPIHHVVEFVQNEESDVYDEE